MDWLNQIFAIDLGSKIPFMVASTAAPKVSKVRIVEAVIIALVIGGAGYFFMVPRIIDVIETKLGYIQRDINEIKQDVRDARVERADLQRQINASNSRNTPR